MWLKGMCVPFLGRASLSWAKQCNIWHQHGPAETLVSLQVIEWACRHTARPADVWEGLQVHLAFVQLVRIAMEKGLSVAWPGNSPD